MPNKFYYFNILIFLVVW